MRLVTRRRLLEWETMAASAARGGAVEWQAFVRSMVPSSARHSRTAASKLPVASVFPSGEKASERSGA